MMFEIVRSARQQREFAATWEQICSKSGWVNDPYGEEAVRYNVLDSRRTIPIFRRVIGTIEFIPYKPNNANSSVEGPDRFSFSAFDDIRDHQRRTWEIDKLCLDERYQRRGHFQRFMHIFHHHAQLYQPKYYIALIERKLYRMLKISYGIAIEQRGEAFEGPDTALVPVVIDIEAIAGNREYVSRVLSRS